MTKSLICFVALLVMACLIAEPVLAGISVSPGTIKIHSDSYLNVFREQAFNPPASAYTHSVITHRASIIVLSLAAVAAWAIGHPSSDIFHHGLHGISTAGFVGAFWPDQLTRFLFNNSERPGGLGSRKAAAKWWNNPNARFIMLLPLSQTDQDPSPYGGISVFASDALLHANPFDSPDLPRDVLQDAAITERVETLRSNPRVNYRGVRSLKTELFEKAFQEFKKIPPESERMQAFQQFLAEESDWIDNYALFHALLDAHGGRAWWDWEPGLRDRDSKELELFRESHKEKIFFYEYLQWQFNEQAQANRRYAKDKNVHLVGDLPIYPNRNSAEVWEYQDRLFDLEGSAGAPPDYYSPEDGQNWGLPPYRWIENEAAVVDFWLKRIRHAARLYDGMRIDHLLGFCGEWIVPKGEKGSQGQYVPSDKEPEKMAALGERVIRRMAKEAEDHGLLLIGEDLGGRPDAVRRMLDRISEELPNLLLYHVLGWRDASVSNHANMLLVEAIHDTPPTFEDRLGDLSDGDLKQVASFFAMNGFEETAQLVAAIAENSLVKRALRAATWETDTFRGENDDFLKYWKYTPIPDAEQTAAAEQVRAFLELWNSASILQLAERVAREVISASLVSKNRMRAFTLQSLKGWRGKKHRINKPNTVTDENWTASMPEPAKQLDPRDVPEELQSVGFGVLAPLFYLRGPLGMGDLSQLPHLIDFMAMSPGGTPGKSTAVPTQQPSQDHSDRLVRGAA